MQTFLPFADFQKSALVLDYKRLGKQRVEAMQLLDVLLERPTKTGKIRTGWRNHPAAKMWHGYTEALKQYHNIVIGEWIERGYKNNMQLEIIEGDVVMPPWLGDEAFHASHRSNLLRKDLEFYSQWGWTEPDDLEYIWPT